MTDLDLRGAPGRARRRWLRWLRWPRIRLPRLPRPDLDIRDAHIYGGLLLAGIGGWLISPAWTCVVLGLIIAALGVFARRLGVGG